MKEEHKKLYDMMFDPVFLVRFGYYDIAIKNEAILTDIIDLENNYGWTNSFYFKVFNMESFAEYLDSNNLKKYFKLTKPKENIATEPIYFSIPKSQSSRRQYKMPNLYSYMALNYFICDNKSEFVNSFSKNKSSTSKFFNQLKFDYNATYEIRQSLLYGGVKKLNLDLSNFYHTLYTHSIPWMINGKDKAKKAKHTGFANHLDKFTTLCQYDETHGIPTGNLLSKIVAELYLCHFDKRMAEKGFLYSRYVDDFSFPFTLEVEKEEFLREFNLICRENNLIINDKKTVVEVFPFTDHNNKASIFSFFDNLDSKTKTKDWIREINTFIDYCIDQESSGNKGSIKCIFSGLKRTLKKKKVSKKQIHQIFSQRNSVTDFNIFEKILDVSLKDSTLTNRFLDFFEDINKLGFSSSKASIIVREYFWNNKKSYRDKIKHYSANHFNQELYQILLYSVEFEDKKLLTKNTLLNLVNEDVDDFSLVLVTIIYLKKKYKIKELISKIDRLFIDTHKNYKSDTIRMSEKFWLFRYFFYFLQVKKIINKKDVNRYCKLAGYNSGSAKIGYESELNWKFVRNNPNANNIDKFFDELLDNEIALVHCGQNEDFKYLPE